MSVQRRDETSGGEKLGFGVRPSGLVGRAREILDLNDMGGWTKAAPTLYPHQWSWDSAFIAIGLAHVDSARAISELETLFSRQWKNGKVPHIVFNPDAPPDSYFPGPEHWTNAGDFPDAPPAPPYTSALCQPPVHAMGMKRIHELAVERADRDEIRAVERFVREIFPAMMRWHRYLHTDRDPEGSGLVTIYHPWESGTDNSPRWDDALDAIEVGEMPGFIRRDLSHVEDPSERPTDAEYARYIWLVEEIKRERCHEETLQKQHPFRVKDVLMSAILVRANRELLALADVAGASEDERRELRGWISSGFSGLESCWDEELGLYLDRDVISGRPMRARTIAGFCALVSGGLPEGRIARLFLEMDSRYFLGDGRLARKLVPSTSPAERNFHPRSYWRGPVWPVISWLYWRSLLDIGEEERADGIMSATLAQVMEGGFAEYFEPFTGEPLGSQDQSWTAAVVLDWCDYVLRRETG